MKKEEKEKLLDDINILGDRYKYLSGNDYNVNSLYNEYKLKKNNYKSAKKQRRRYGRIKNIRITRNIAILMLPVVLTTCLIGLCNYAVHEDSFPKGYETQELQFISADNMGNYESKFNDDDVSLLKVLDELDIHGSDKINITSCWLEEDNKLVRYKYEALTDFHTEEEIKEVINADYFDLMNTYDFEEKTKEVALIDQVSDKDISSDYKIEVKANVKMNEESCNEYIAPYKQTEQKKLKLSVVIGSFISLIGSGFVYSIFVKDQISIAKKKYKNSISVNNLDRSILKEKKKELKSLKRKL